MPNRSRASVVDPSTPIGHAMPMRPSSGASPQPPRGRSTITAPRPSIAATRSPCWRAVAAQGVPRWLRTSSYELHVNGSSHEVRDAWVGESLLYVLRERLGLLGSARGVRAGRVRLVQRAGRRRTGVQLPGAGCFGSRPGDRHHRGHRPARVTERCATGIRRVRCRAVRVLHPGSDHGGTRPARTHTRSRPTPRSARSCPATSAAAPATGESSKRSASGVARSRPSGDRQ